MICTSRDGDRFWKLNECYIRGNSIKYLRIPEDVIDQVVEEEMKSDPRKITPGGRGGRGGRLQTGKRGGGAGRGSGGKGEGKGGKGEGKGGEEGKGEGRGGGKGGKGAGKGKGGRGIQVE